MKDSITAQVDCYYLSLHKSLHVLSNYLLNSAYSVASVLLESPVEAIGRLLNAVRSIPVHTRNPASG